MIRVWQCKTALSCLNHQRTDLVNKAFSFFCFSSSLLWLLLTCSSSPPPVLLDVAWEVSCVERGLCNNVSRPCQTGYCPSPASHTPGADFAGLFIGTHISLVFWGSWNWMFSLCLLYVKGHMTQLYYSCIGPQAVRWALLWGPSSSSSCLVVAKINLDKS